MKVEYVTCRACGRAAGLFAASGQLTGDKLPDPFEMMCPHCGAFSLAQKSSIQAMPSKPVARSVRPA